MYCTIKLKGAMTNTYDNVHVHMYNVCIHSAYTSIMHMIYMYNVDVQCLYINVLI